MLTMSFKLGHLFTESKTNTVKLLLNAGPK